MIWDCKIIFLLKGYLSFVFNTFLSQRIKFKQSLKKIKKN